MMLESATGQGLDLTLLPIRTGFSESEVASALRRLNAVVIGDKAFGANAVRSVEEFIESFLAVQMATHPLEAGVSLQTLRSSSKAPAQVIDFAVNRLSSGGRVEVEGSLVRPAGWTSKLSEREQALSDAILHAICIQPSEPPSVGELQLEFGGSTQALIRRLERQGELERVAEDRYYSRAALEKMVGSLKASLEPGRKYSPAELKDVLGVSRKYLIPFLEFCDRRGVTERSETGRVLRNDAI
jgi:selenocysteine-specific elongation factor